MRPQVSLAILGVLTACNVVPEKQELLRSWVGADSTEVLARYRVPTYDDPGDNASRIWTYRFTESYPMFVGGYTDPKGVRVGGYMTTQTSVCRFVFVIGRDAKVASTDTKSGGCRDDVLARYKDQIADRPWYHRLTN